MVKLADAPDSKSGGVNAPWGFDSPLRHHRSLRFALVPKVKLRRSAFGALREAATKIDASDSVMGTLSGTPTQNQQQHAKAHSA